jgi:hypothetical protein
MPGFVNRTEELARLQDLFDSDDAELAVAPSSQEHGPRGI